MAQIWIGADSDVRLFRLYEGTSQIHQINIAKQLLAQSTLRPWHHQMHQPVA